MGVSRHWSFSKESMQKMIDKGLIVQMKRGCSSKKHYLDESKKTLQDIWVDIPAIQSIANEHVN